MSDIEVRVYREGRLLKTIQRPVRRNNGAPCVTYRKKKYPLIDGNRIHLDGNAGVQQSPLNDGQEEPDEVVEIKPWEPDSDQIAVITAPPEDRLIVDAGPGTGKTAVACARIAHLIGQGVEPSNVWLLSFTRTAVAEIRQRIRSLADDEARAAAVRISTLDSKAWHLRDFDLTGRDKIFSGYDENIEAVIGLLRSDDYEIREYFETIEHLIVDEAQDVVGIRAELIESIIELLADDCGITVFTDDAQAIYGFSEDDSVDAGTRQQGTLPERLREHGSASFSSLNLKTIHRTESESLKRIFVGTRKVVLDTAGDPDARLKQIIAEVEDSADGQVGDVLAQHLNGRDDTLVLFRRRSEVLTASSFLADQGVQHRIRMSQMPPHIHPWLALILWDFTEPYLNQDQFLARWIERVNEGAEREMGFEEAWAALFRAAGDRSGRIEVRRLREKLSRPRPPVDLHTAEIGTRGPILGTIHASKGREAPVVHLMLPYENNFPAEDVDEECRVAFVGATRARRTLRVGQGYGIFTRKLESGRLYGPTRKNRGPRQKVQLGLANDIDEGLQVSRRLFPGRAEATAAQDFLREHLDDIAELTAEANKEAKFRYELSPTEADGLRIGAFSQHVNSSLFDVGDAIAHDWGGRRLRPRFDIRHLWMIGVSSCFLSEDDPRVDLLHPPYNRTGAFLVPLVSAFPVVYFTRSRSSG